MTTNVPGFQSFFRVLLYFVMIKLAPCSMRVKEWSFHYIQQYLRPTSVIPMAAASIGNAILIINTRAGLSTGWLFDVGLPRGMLGYLRADSYDTITIALTRARHQTISVRLNLGLQGQVARSLHTPGHFTTRTCQFQEI